MVTVVTVVTLALTMLQYCVRVEICTALDVYHVLDWTCMQVSSDYASANFGRSVLDCYTSVIGGVGLCCNPPSPDLSQTRVKFWTNWASVCSEAEPTTGF